MMNSATSNRATAPRQSKTVTKTRLGETRATACAIGTRRTADSALEIAAEVGGMGVTHGVADLFDGTRGIGQKNDRAACSMGLAMPATSFAMPGPLAFAVPTTAGDTIHATGL